MYRQARRNQFIALFPLLVVSVLGLSCVALDEAGASPSNDDTIPGLVLSCCAPGIPRQPPE
jgi:hypothetical protein